MHTSSYLDDDDDDDDGNHYSFIQWRPVSIHNREGDQTVFLLNAIRITPFSQLHLQQLRCWPLELSVSNGEWQQSPDTPWSQPCNSLQALVDILHDENAGQAAPQLSLARRPPFPAA
mmetsp:Transcript_86149/g.180201  ORF Transcript_86149/g.180201 Transcript_86149/m.180201 type:complete len:117 (+) Transcript_86149:842-1192(+)